MSERVKPWLILGLIFVAGIATGMALSFALRAEWLRPPGAQQIQHHWMERLTDRLQLTPDQQEKIGSILAKAGDQIRSVHQEEVNRMGEIFKETDAQIAPLLTADQQVKFGELQKERAREFSRHMRHGEGGPRPGGPPPEN